MSTRQGQSRINPKEYSFSHRRKFISQAKSILSKKYRYPILLALISSCVFIPTSTQRSSLITNVLALEKHLDSSSIQKVSTNDLGGASIPKSGTAEDKTNQQVAVHQTSLSVGPDNSSPVRQFCHPLGGQGILTQGNGGQTHQGRMYYAYDLASPIGTPVYAMQSGQVIGLYDRYPDTGGGPDKSNKFNYVYLEHDDGFRSVYAHLQEGFRNEITLAIGDRVERGDLIGFSGNSGWSGGPHLHVELQQPGESPKRFTTTVPFEIASQCDSGYIAQG